MRALLKTRLCGQGRYETYILVHAGCTVRLVHDLAVWIHVVLNRQSAIKGAGVAGTADREEQSLNGFFWTWKDGKSCTCQASRVSWWRAAA